MYILPWFQATYQASLRFCPRAKLTVKAGHIFCIPEKFILQTSCYGKTNNQSLLSEEKQAQAWTHSGGQWCDLFIYTSILFINLCMVTAFKVML